MSSPSAMILCPSRAVSKPSNLFCRTPDELTSHFENFAATVSSDLPAPNRISRDAFSSDVTVEDYDDYVYFSSAFVDEIKLDRSVSRPDVTRVKNEYNADLVKIQELILGLGVKAQAIVTATQAQKVYDSNIGSKERSRLRKQSLKFDEKLSKVEFMREANERYAKEARDRRRRQQPRGGSATQGRASPYSRPSARAQPRRNRSQRQFLDDEAEDAGDDFQSDDEHDGYDSEVL